MNKIILTIAVCVASVASLMAQRAVNELETSHFTADEICSPMDIDNLLSRKKISTFEIEYLECVKRLMAKCKDSDSFAQHLITAYPSLAGAEQVKALAKNLYPNEVVDSAKEQVRARVQDYFNMVSNLDERIANDLWAESDNVSIITPRSQFVGRETIMNDFLQETFSSMKSRKLHSLCEVINIYGDSANVQLYWIFDTVDSKGEPHQTRGRESLMFTKVADQWRLVHVHYSRMPQ